MPDENKTRRLVLGFLFAPGAGALPPAVWGLFSPAHWESAFFGGMIGLFFSYQFGLPIGFVLFFIFRWRKWRSLKSYLLAGFLTGIAIFELTWPGFIVSSVRQFHWDSFLSLAQKAWPLEFLFGLSGATGTLVFWLITKRNRETAHSAA
jgi:hypothetical protein